MDHLGLSRCDQEQTKDNNEGCGEHRHLATAEDETRAGILRGTTGETKDGESRTTERAGSNTDGQARHVAAE